MQTLAIVLDTAFALAAIYLVVQIVAQYRKETGSVWERLLATAKDSATLLWNKFVILAAGIIDNLENIANALGLPEITTWIKSTFPDPHTLASIMAGIAIVSWMARLRTLGQKI